MSALVSARKPNPAALARKVRELGSQIEAYQREVTTLRERCDEALRQQNEAIRESRFFREIVKHLIGER